MENRCWYYDWLSNRSYLILDFLQDERVDVDVISVPEPTIQISGTDDISRDYEDFKLGVRIFADVHILMTTSSSSGGKVLLY